MDWFNSRPAGYIAIILIQAILYLRSCAPFLLALTSIKRLQLYSWLQLGNVCNAEGRGEQINGDVRAEILMASLCA